MFLKLATYDRSDKMFLLTSKFHPQGVVSPCPRAIYMYKIMKKLYKIRLQRDLFETCSKWPKWQVVSVDIKILSPGVRATEILKSKSVRSTDDVIDVIRTYVRQSWIVTKTNDSSFSSKSVSEIDYFSNTLESLNWSEAYMGGKKAKTCLSKFDIKFLVFVYI